MAEMKSGNVPEEFLKPYDAASEESHISALWEKAGYADPDTCVQEGITSANAEAYSIVLPPPNVTGTLHMGHAAMLAIEDILIRYNRMRGKRTLWLPGTDSAAIATQSKVEADLYKKEKKTRHDVGREELLRRIDAFTKESKGIITDQVRRMGSSLDWSRYAYTMDDARYHAVMTAFVRMYEAGLIYRGDRIVNWDPKLQTTVSDDEVEYIEQTDPFYFFQYGPFVIGTVRPETKFGDKYVVMHPADERYKDFTHGQRLELEWINGRISATVIKDEAVDMSVGSGVMTITPAHSAIDFEIAQRHGLDVEQIIDERGVLLPIAGEFAGQHIKKARPLIVEKLREKGLLVKVDDAYAHSVATNSRGGGIIEPQIKRQWFVAVNKEFTLEHSQFPDLPAGSKTTLKLLMRHAVESGAIKIVPERFEKIYYHWVDNLRDWCISRQIWFGHRIPVWYREKDSGEDGDIYVGTEPPTEGEGWQQDPDTLDTWFSSGLWTLSTLGWPNEDARGKPVFNPDGSVNPDSDLGTYHPTSVLETGYDILFFWVARMILMTGFLRGDVPFKHVYLHGLVRDDKGRKMSKSLGNIIDPLDMVGKYGADATRLSLVVGVQPGNDLKLSEDRVRGYKHFANKLWNIARFVLENSTGQSGTDAPTPAMQSSVGSGGDRETGALLLEGDEALVAEARTMAERVSAHIEAFRLDLAADTVYHFVWDRFAAEILEESKPVLKAGGEAAASRRRALLSILDISLRTLHPFMPFVTEAIWQRMPDRERPVLMVAQWPANHTV